MLAPVAVGGVGGSGTRLVAQLLRGAGIHMGDDLNGSSDTLWFTLLFKRREILGCDEAEFDLLTDALVAALAGGRPLAPGVEALVRGLARDDRSQLSASWLQERCETLLAAARQPAHDRPWGWKEPNTHVVIERLWQRMPGLRYIHVVRHGLDMAYSTNQNQLHLWGSQLFDQAGPADPARSLAYWCRIHRRMQDLLAENHQRMYWLDYDALCSDPYNEAEKLCAFLGLDSDIPLPMLAGIRSPGSPRHASESLAGFDPADIEYVASLGYRIAGCVKDMGSLTGADTTDSRTTLHGRAEVRASSQRH